MLKTKPIALLLSLSPLAISIAHAQNDSLSLNGFTGLFNIPNAHTTGYGTGSASYSDMMFYRNEYRHNNNIVGSFGVFPHVEISGRVAWFNTHTNLFESSEPEARDLSAHIKINIPLIPDNWFELAIGQQDIGGEANYFDAKYIVASRSFGPVRIDAGVGQNDLNNRLDGAFGGIELSPFEWISLIAEYDAQDLNTGFRLSTPSSWLPKDFRVDLTVLADTDNETSSGKSFYGLNMKFPLGGGFSKQRPTQPSRTAVRTASLFHSQPYLLAQGKSFRKHHRQTTTDTQSSLNLPAHQTKSKQTETIKLLTNLFEKLGFERIKIGTRENNLIVAFENNIYNQSELDAIGKALRVIASNAQSFQRATLILKNQNLPVIAIDTNPKGYQQFLNKNASAPIYAYYPNPLELSSVTWHRSTAQASSIKPRITISPIISNGIATELGVWDYSWGLSVNAASHLWHGALVSATFTNEIDSSEDFDSGYFKNNKIRNDLSEMTFQQGFKISNYGYNNTHLGRFRYDYTGIHNETLFHTPSGQHQLSIKLGDFEHEETEEDKSYHLATYRYYIPQYDVSIRATAGEFWNGDNGYRINTLFRFGDQTVDLFYKNTEAEFIGIAWTLPLTPEKDWSSKYLQIKGNEAWRWGFQTRIGEDVNQVSFSVANIPTMEWEIERTYLNNDKLSPDYIYQNLNRLKKVALD